MRLSFAKSKERCTLKMLLTRIWHLLFKDEGQLALSQTQRAEVLLRFFPDILQAYDLCCELGCIYGVKKSKGIAFTQLAKLYDKVEQSRFILLNNIIRTI